MPTATPATPHRTTTTPIRRRSNRVGLALGSCLLLALLPACSWTSGDQYFIHWGPRTDVIVRQKTSWDLTFAGNLFYNDDQSFADQMANFRCNGNHSRPAANRCVMKLLNTRTVVSGAAQGYWDRATLYTDQGRFDDFNGAFNRVRSSASSASAVADCLTLSYYPYTSNWTERDRSDSNCRPGKHTWE